jgi:hypothetical protein
MSVNGQVELDEYIFGMLKDLSRYLAFELGYPDKEMLKYIKNFVEKENM